ncbi:MAG TPA: gliding motility-associated C-terminal domain-containing protein [Flavobacteriales bacterium]|nr:gliding motility-associated C-terminal domain-containing protein [Flavobacteriales bacterium]
MRIILALIMTVFLNLGMVSGDEECNPHVIVPSSLTPNGDGKNDCFYIEFKQQPSNTRLKIFDRWGTRMFETVKINECWEGKLKERKLPEGVYYWIISFRFTEDGEEFTCNGNFRLSWTN